LTINEKNYRNERRRSYCHYGNSEDVESEVNLAFAVNGTRK